MDIKILLNINPFFSSSASANRWLTLIEGLNKLGASIEVLVIGNYQSVEEKNQFKSNSQINGIKIKYLTSTVVGGLWQRRFHHYIGRHFQFQRIKKKIKKELENFNGIVWSENELKFWELLSEFPNKKFLLFAEMSEFLDIHNYNKGNALQRKLGDAKQKYFENNYINKLDGLALMTHTLMNHYRDFNNHPQLVHIPMTVDLDRFIQKLPTPESFDSPYIAFVGVMNNAKDGVDILIEAFSKISGEFSDLKLYLVGPWNYDTPAHLNRIKELNLNNRIFWKGEYPRDTVPAIIQNASLLVLPRPDSKQAQGGFPTKLGEYLATGNPVCATRVGELPLYLNNDESVFFAEPGSVDSFAEAMKRALSDEENAKRVGQKGKEVAEKHFNKDIQAELLYNFLKQLTNENQR